MYFLTFDTSLDKTYVTLFKNGTKILSNIIESTDDKYHSAFLIQNLADVLKENKLTMQDIKAIGVNVGPGSFTGIRACLTIARVIAQQLNCPLIGISSLEILSRINHSDMPSVITMDARKGMCYYAEYSANGEVLQEPRLETLDSAIFNDKTHTIITDNTMKSLLTEKGIKCLCYSELNHDLGTYLGNIVAGRIATKKEFNWAEVKPLYLQNPSITVSKKTLL